MKILVFRLPYNITNNLDVFLFTYLRLAIFKIFLWTVYILIFSQPKTTEICVYHGVLYYRPSQHAMAYTHHGNHTVIMHSPFFK